MKLQCFVLSGIPDSSILQSTVLSNTFSNTILQSFVLSEALRGDGKPEKSKTFLIFAVKNGKSWKNVSLVLSCGKIRRLPG